MNKDYYKTLGVDKSATPDEIKTAFRKLAHEHHPDKGGNEAKFKEANEAYQVLGNAEKRRQYDQFGSSFQNGQAGGGAGQWQNFSGSDFDFGDLGDIFGGMGDIFGFGGGRGRSQQRTRGRDLEMLVTLDFMEAVFGIEKAIHFHRSATCSHCQGNGAEPGSKVETCPTCKGQGKIAQIQRTILGSMRVESVCPSCHGEGQKYSEKCHVCSGNGVKQAETELKVKIPAGINTGESIRLSGQGDAGAKGSELGDLFLRIKVIPSKKFVRSGYDIHTKETIGVKQAILGDKIEVETVEGKLTLKIPEGTQSGTVFRLKDKGIPILNSRSRGDHLVEVTVKIPKGLSKKEQKIMEEINI
ncbi:molecular chaperone DnaJ [Candidatus Falkowbacteria bacterium CG10_big_fil_rev_8_21_14_0_10_39_9]|uniref:Chaperone protein DnaJ n=1 Tax=Candidatus Falkowbacteria bacterium CG10_big_fil_rev_8_21_14_0_10_39_9 TaxID=1974566 RepID=A0A2M6WPM1_9BACT|nr:MAG: molecular chaperone DnaJ [Candidatus Falkowbacteria bacterium CG10_big_fil_rev_8_21_14_0_10_39_9]